MATGLFGCQGSATFVVFRRGHADPNAVRRRDLRDNPRLALTTWGAHGAAAIVYGRASEVPDSLRDTRPGATGAARRTVALDITITRIYAMKAREQL